MKKRFRSLLNSSPVKCSNMFFSTYFSCGCTETDFYPWLHFVRRENQRDICCSFFQSTCQKCIQHCSEIDIYCVCTLFMLICKENFIVSRNLSNLYSYWIQQKYITWI